MKILLSKIFLTILASALIFQFGSTQTVADFEDFNLNPGEYLNDASPESVFQSGSIELPNSYDAEFNFWTGWAISADTNTTTPGFLNQFSAIPGKGAFNSNAYGVGYVYDPIVIGLLDQATGKPMIGLYVTNSTYTYLSMRDGDPFAKKFGGETGDDPDFLMITFKKYSQGVLSQDSINVYLADYRFTDPNEDYLIADWTYVDLNPLGPMDSLSIGMTSSDNGIFGMNTPAYVCVDYITTDDLQPSIIPVESISEIQVSPNPATDLLYIETEEAGPCSISNLQGRLIWSGELSVGKYKIPVANWPKGIYVVSQNGHTGVKICIQ